MQQRWVRRKNHEFFGVALFFAQCCTFHGSWTHQSTGYVGQKLWCEKLLKKFLVKNCEFLVILCDKLVICENFSYIAHCNLELHQIKGVHFFFPHHGSDQLKAILGSLNFCHFTKELPESILISRFWKFHYFRTKWKMISDFVRTYSWQ